MTSIQVVTVPAASFVGEMLGLLAPIKVQIELEYLEPQRGAWGYQEASWSVVNALVIESECPSFSVAAGPINLFNTLEDDECDKVADELLEFL